MKRTTATAEAIRSLAASHLRTAPVVRPSDRGPRASAGRNVRAATSTTTPIRSADEHRRVGAERARARRARPASRPARLPTASAASSGTNRAEQHREPAHQVGERDPESARVAGRVRLHEAGVAGERRAVVVALRGVGVERLGESVRAGVEDRGPAVLVGDRERGQSRARGSARRWSRSRPASSPCASIFLPRYSGVRPTISPAMKTVSRTNSSIP